MSLALTGQHTAATGSLIDTEKGCRKVLTEEWYRMKGVPHPWAPLARCRSAVLRRPGVHAWTVMGQAVGGVLPAERPSSLPTPTVAPSRNHLNPRRGHQHAGSTTTWRSQTPSTWNWSPPDLSEGLRLVQCQGPGPPRRRSWTRRRRRPLPGRAGDSSASTDGTTDPKGPNSWWCCGGNGLRSTGRSSGPAGP